LFKRLGGEREAEDIRSHIPGFRMKDVQVDVRGDEAVVEHGIEATPDSTAQAKTPSGGELPFKRPQGLGNGE
jgi:hypothetical protein